MKFLYPEFLYALLALVIPVIIHLFNFRRFKRVVFPNTRFLKEVELQTRSRSKLKHLLVLFSRLLALAALVLAFAQPYFPTDNSKLVAGQKAISIYIDNSFSMDQENESGNLLAQSKEMAEEIAMAYDQSDRFQLLTNDFEGRHQRVVSREEFMELLDEVEIGPASRKTSEVHARMSDVLMKEDVEGKRAFIISDMQQSAVDLEEISADSSISFNLIPVIGNEVGNVFIDSIWFRNPVRQLNGQEELTVRVVNGSGKNVQNVPLKVTINGVQKAIGNVSLQPYSTADSTVFFSNTEAGIMEGSVSLTDHPITFDDTHYFAYSVAQKNTVLLVKNQVASRVEALYSSDDNYELTTSRVNAVNYSAFSDQDLIILENLERISSGLIQELVKFTDNGGSVVILPALRADKDSYNELYLALSCNTFSEIIQEEMKVSNIDPDHPIFNGVFSRIPRNVDLPKVNHYLTFFKRTQSQEERLMNLANGSSFASVYPSGKGRTYCFAVGTESEMSNFTRHSFFVTTLLRIAELSQGSEQLYYTIGKDDVLEVKYNSPLTDQQFHLVQTNGSLDILPERQGRGGVTQLYLHGQVSEADVYKLTFGEEKLKSFGFNYPREESILKFLDRPALEERISRSGLSNFKLLERGVEGFKGAVQELTEGKKLWKKFIMLALLFLGFEVLLLKFWKT